MDKIKVVLLGDTGVGKTCIANRFVFNKYSDKDLPSKNATFVTKNFEVPQLKKNIRYQIWDTAGQERYRSMAAMYYKNAEAAILVYDLTNPKSFEGLKQWEKDLRETNENQIPLAIVGNKLDAADNSEIDMNKVEEYVNELNGISLTVSAKHDININKIFELLALKLNNFPDEKKHTNNKKLSTKTQVRDKDNCC